MSKRAQRGYYDPGAIVPALLIAGVVMGVVVAYGLPWLWAVIKPFLHAITA